MDGAESGTQANPHSGAVCANCRTPLKGAYCHACGQSAHLHHSLWHLLEEALHGVLHFETKGWRTLPLLVGRPGLLTRRYIDGQRTRYVSPLALFLFMVFLLFFAMSFTDGEHAVSISAKTGDRSEVLAQLTKNVSDSKEDVQEAVVALDKARRQSEDVASAETELAVALAAQHAAERALAKFGAAAPEVIGAARSAAPLGAAALPAPEPQKDWRTRLARAKVDTGNPQVDAVIRRQFRNPDLFLYKLKNLAFKFSFLLLPISLPFLWLMFIGRRDVTVYDHAVFSLYSLSFMSLFFSCITVLALAGVSAAVAPLLAVVPPVHMFAQLRGTYGLGIKAALWRMLALLGVAGGAFLTFLSFIVVAAAR